MKLSKCRAGTYSGIIFPLLMAVIVCLTIACATPRVWLPRSGQVLEWPDQKSIEGAVVVGLWEGSIPIIPADSMTTCYHVGSAVTDAEGHYRLPAFTEGPGRVIDRHVVITVFKAGYRESIDERGFYRVKNGVQYLEKDIGTREERLAYLKHVFTGCDRAGVSMRNMYPLEKAIYEEAKQLARTKEDYEWVERFRRSAARSAITQDGHMSGFEYDRLTDEYLKDHLQ